MPPLGKTSNVTQQVLGNPNQYPRELTSWIAKKFSGNKALQIALTQLPNYPGRIVGSASQITNYATTATVFSGSSDVFASPASFKADGSSSYLLTATAPAWIMSVASQLGVLWWSLDGAQQGVAGEYETPNVSYPIPFCGKTIWKPSKGVHTVNLRGTVPVNTTTLTLEMGSAPTGFGPAVLTVEVL